MNDYTIKAGDYTYIRRDGQLEVLDKGTYNHRWDERNYFPPVTALFNRIEDLEKTIRAVLDGTLVAGGIRRDDGMKNFDIDSLHRVADWETLLRNALEQK